MKSLFDRLDGAELLTYQGLLRGMAPDVIDARVTELLDVLALADAGRTLVIDYSAGMKKKIALACALLHAPRLLVLDEPFEAVDPVSAATIKAILRGFVATGGSIVLSSHVMALAHTGYTTNLPLADLTGDKAWVVWEVDGGPLPRVHGGPARLLVPHLYFWKSAKWVSGLRLMDHDEPGFWERNGYHDRGDPWREQRYQGD